MRNLIVKLVVWIIEHYTVPVESLRQARHVDAQWKVIYDLGRESAVSQKVRMLFETAAGFCADEETNHPNQGGEWKRHQVLAKMIKRHPTASKRDICMAIEFSLPAREGT